MKAILRMFRQPTSVEMAERELAEARRQLLEAESAKDFATQMVAYNAARVKRLSEYLSKPVDPATYSERFQATVDSMIMHPGAPYLGQAPLPGPGTRHDRGGQPCSA